jgi:hypothetical protein
MVGMALLIQHAHMQQRTAVVLQHAARSRLYMITVQPTIKDVYIGLNGWHGSAC